MEGNKMNVTINHFRVARFILIGLLGVCTIKGKGASALPQIEKALLVVTPVDGVEQTFRIFRDKDDIGTFWWAPYRMDLATNPRLGTPIFSWNPLAKTPRISLVAGLERLPLAVDEIVKRQIATQTGQSQDGITLFSLALMDVNLVLHFGRDESTVYGEWTPKTSVIVRNVPENIVLSEEENSLLLQAWKKDRAGMRVALGFIGSFPAYKTERRLTRTYDSGCVTNSLMGTKDLHSLPVQPLSRRKILGMMSRIERNCVTRRQEFGESLSMEEAILSWIPYLVTQGLLREVGNDFQLGFPDDWAVFRREQQREFFTTIPEEVGLYPFQFGTFLQALEPTL
jgi:hypothetical protein